MPDFILQTSNGKKESIFESFKNVERQASAFVHHFQRYHLRAETLVFLNNIYNNFLKHPRWKDLDKLAKIFFIFWYGQKNGFFAITVDFSNVFCEKLRNQHYPEDFTRRRLNANLKRYLGFIPQYSFVLEDLARNGHLHGIIQPNLDKKKLKIALKRTFLGKNYRQSTINNRSVQIKRMWDAGGWLAYIFKRNLAIPQMFKCYVNQILKQNVYAQYRKISKQKEEK